MKDWPKFFDSFSPFWIYFDKEAQILDVSQYFAKVLSFKDHSIFEYLLFNRFYLRQEQSLFEALCNKIIDFEFSPEKISFRATFHNFQHNGLIVAWPKLRDINDIKRLNLSSEMSHPNCILTDLLITKDLLQKTQTKINQIELKKVESELNFSRQRSKTIIDYMMEGTIVFNSDQEVLDWNPSISKVFNLKLNSKSDFIKLPTNLKLKDSHDKFYLVNELSLLLTKAPFYGWQLQLFKDDLYLKTLRFNCTKADLGDDFFYILTVMDITEEIEKEKALNIQKELAQENAKLASLGELAAGVGHEINNPLSIISGQLTIMQKELEKKSLDEAFYERFSKIKKSVQRITNIVKGLRTFARADSVENTYFNFSELLVETIDMIKEIFANEGIIFHKEIESNIWTFANLGRLQQVFVNLLNNAKDALVDSPQKVITISLVKSRELIVLKIQDTGSGITSDVLDKMFEPFFTTKEVNKGTGIGLALVDSIIKEHCGHVRVSSEINQGTIFTIEIPIQKDLSLTIENQNKIQNTPQPQEMEAYLVGKKVLIVDDEEDIRDILAQMLDIYGVECYQASNAQEAITIYQENTDKIELILTDLTMPKMNGIEFISYLKNTMHYNHPSYLITGGLNIELQKVEQVVDGLISKPFKESDIYHILLKSFVESRK